MAETASTEPVPARRDYLEELLGGGLAAEDSCRVCGCTAGDPCLTDFGPCTRIEPTLCSRCARILRERNVDHDT